MKPTFEQKSPVAEACESLKQDAQGLLAATAGSATRTLTLTIEEIRDLAQFCGMVIAEPTAKEKEDERETEIAIAPWPAKGVKGDDGMLPPHKHIAYFDEYPEEGCMPLGSPNSVSATASRILK